MIVTTYTCDKCGHSQESGTQMWHVAVVLKGPGMPWPLFPKITSLWCRKCVETLALLPQGGGAEDAPPPPDPLPTLEDMIREIIRNEVEAA